MPGMGAGTTDFGGLPDWNQPQNSIPTIGGTQIPGMDQPGGQGQLNQMLPGWGGGGMVGQQPSMGPGSGGYGSDPQNAQDQLNQMLPGWGGGGGVPNMMGMWPQQPQGGMLPGQGPPAPQPGGNGMQTGGGWWPPPFPDIQIQQTRMSNEYGNNPGGGGPHMDFTPGAQQPQGGMGQPQQQWAPPNFGQGGGAQPPPWQGNYPQGNPATGGGLQAPASPGTATGHDGQTMRVNGRNGGPVAKGAAPGSNPHPWMNR